MPVLLASQWCAGDNAKSAGDFGAVVNMGNSGVALGASVTPCSRCRKREIAGCWAGGWAKWRWQDSLLNGARGGVPGRCAGQFRAAGDHAAGGSGRRGSRTDRGGGFRRADFALSWSAHGLRYGFRRRRCGMVAWWWRMFAGVIAEAARAISCAGDRR